MSAHWHHLANTIEHMLTSAHPTPQPKRQIEGFSRFFAQLKAECPYHSSEAYSEINRKMENSTPCKIVTTENFILKLGTRDYVEEATYYTIFDVDRFSGASPHIHTLGEI